MNLTQANVYNAFCIYNRFHELPLALVSTPHFDTPSKEALRFIMTP